MTSKTVKSFNIACRDCPRIAKNLIAIKQAHPDYYCLPVPPFGSDAASLLIVGLGPGKHGANATGRPFTGDYAGILLYKTLHEFAFSSKPESISTEDGLTLHNCRITNAVKCLPPGNKPTTEEIITCNKYLAEELKSSTRPGVILALGKIAHDSVLRAMSLKLNQFKFAHNAEHHLGDNIILLDSYHCSRYNTQTRRLTEAMFKDVIKHAKKLIDG